MLWNLSTILTGLADSFTRLEKYTYYVPGQRYQIVRVPQPVMRSFDVGHICLVITNPDNTETSIGFYPENFRSGNPSLFANLFGEVKSVLVSPDPLLNKALRDPVLNPKVAVIYTGYLTQGQTNRLNTLTFSNGFEESGDSKNAAIESVIHGMPESYTVFPMFVKGGENCVSWVQKMFPIKCGFSIPWMCMEDLQRSSTTPK